MRLHHAVTYMRRRGEQPALPACRNRRCLCAGRAFAHATRFFGAQILQLLALFRGQDIQHLALSLQAGQLDVGAAALCATDERKKTMKFSDTYYDAGIVVIVAKDNTAIKSVDDLKTGKYKVAVQTGCAAYEYAAANLPESCLQSFDSQALAYKAVEDGQADATIYDLPGTNYGIKTGAKFAATGLQVAAGVPLACDERPDYKAFRVGLFGLDKLHNVARTVATLEKALDRVG